MKTSNAQVKSRTRNTQHVLRITHYVSRFTLLAILLLTFSLRLYRLDAQSFWNDEGNSARLSERSIDLILKGTASDIHPPGYYLLLHFWRMPFGHSEFALRALSAFAGLMLVVFTYLLGCRLFGRTTGLVAAFLGAISPFAITYSQEARMYALLGALAASSTYSLVRVLEKAKEKRQGARGKRQEVRSKNAASCLLPPASCLLPPASCLLPPASCLLPLASCILIAAVGLYTQYAFAFVLLVHNVVFVVWWLATVRSSVHHWRWLAAWAGMQGAIILLYLPWLRIAVKSITGWPSAGQAYELEPALLNVWRWLSVGHTLPLEEAGLALAGFGALLLVGLWPRPAKRWFGLTTCILYLALPIALIFALDLYKEAWLKFLIVVLAPAHVLIARGIENLVAFTCYVLRITFHVSRHTQHAARCFLLFACAVPIYPSLHNLYVNPAYARDDYRQIASDIKAAAGPDSAVILNAPNQWEVFTYYYPDRDVHPVPYRPGLDEVDAFLSPLVEQYERFFVLYWGEAESDPQRLVESWLANHAYKADERWVGRVRLATYGVAALPEAPDVTLEARFGEMLLLGGYALGDATPLPGDVLPVTLFWETAMPVTEPYKVSVQLLDETGQLVAQHDGEPGGGFAPTMTWQPGQVIADLHGVLIPPASSPGPYSLVLAVYHAHTGERLDATLDGKSIGDHLALSAVNVSSP